MTRSAFFDTNIALYLLTGDEAKADLAEDLLATGGTISVQVLNEFVAVARCKGATPWPKIDEVLSALRQVCRVEPLTVATHERALALARRYGFPIYDATIAASALLSGCTTLYSEDFQHGQTLDGLTIHNPFR
ncbi:PIN domain-containing protein [Methylibium sp.]|uniref:PIN domain-containing protein n=1 Tax=Methylibium sp. TaxID=2067992 RepID=UPI003D0C4E1A